MYTKILITSVEFAFQIYLLKENSGIRPQQVIRQLLIQIGNRESKNGSNICSGQILTLRNSGSNQKIKSVIEAHSWSGL